LGVYAVEFAEVERNFGNYDSVPHPEAESDELPNESAPHLHTQRGSEQQL